MSKEGEKERRFDLLDRLIGFSVRVITVVDALPNTHIGKHFSGQLLRSGTSPAANYGEAQSAESRKDFAHKLKIAVKELRETDVWLQVIQRASLIEPPEKLTPLMSECNELISILVTSIQTAKKNS